MKSLIISLIFIFILIFNISTEASIVYDAHSFKKFKFPQRNYSVIVKDEGYFPDQIVVFEGEQVRFFVTAVANKDLCFIIKDHNLFMSAKKNIVSESEVTFSKSGIYEFYCPNFAHKGRLIVLGKEQQEKINIGIDKSSQRLPASMDSQESWIPRDY
jgi:plastocyanin